MLVSDTAFNLILEALMSRSQIAALSAEDKEQLAYNIFRRVADKLTESGIDNQLVGTAAFNVGYLMLGRQRARKGRTR